MATRHRSQAAREEGRWGVSEDEMKLDMLVAELDYENRLLRARNERLTAENEALEKQVKELQARLAQPQASGEH